MTYLKKSILLDKNGTIEGQIVTNPNTTNTELLVNLEGHECSDNSTTTPLGIDGVFTGSDWQDTKDYGTLLINVCSDEDSATDGLVVQWSNDASTVSNTDEFSILADECKVFTFGCAVRYYRVIYTNGAVAQSTFSLTSLLKRTYVKPSSHRIQDNIVGEDDAELVKSVLTALDENGDFINIGSRQGDNGENLNVSVDQVETTTNSLKVIDYSHAELHSGSHYKAGYQDTTLNTSDVVEVLFVTPNTTKWAHWVRTARATALCTVEVFEGTTTSADGTAITPLNRNRNSANTADVSVYHTPTITADGTKISTAWFGSDAKDPVGGSERGENEIILKQNTKYLVRLTAGDDAMSGAVGGDWYEHTNK